jgi:HD-like signal output (HDOD) protein
MAQAALVERMRQNLVRLGRAAPESGTSSRRTKTAIFSMAALSPEERLKLVTEKVQTVKALPGAVAKIFEIFSKENIDLRELEQVVRTDLATATMILRVANSASQAPGMRVMEVKTALLRIGLREARNAVAALSVFKLFAAKGKTAAFNRVWFWLHAMATAVIAEELAVRAARNNSGELYLLGLIHDLGKIIMDDNLGSDYAVALHLSAAKNISLADAEKQTFQKNHAEVGAEVAAKWNMPEASCALLAGHHEPDGIVSGTNENALTVLMANHLAKAYLLGNGGDRLSPIIPDAAWQRLKATEVVAPEFAERIRAKVLETVEMLGIKREVYDMGFEPQPLPHDALAVQADGLIQVRAFLAGRGVSCTTVADWNAAAAVSTPFSLVIAHLPGELLEFRRVTGLWQRLPLNPLPALFLFGPDRPPERPPKGCFCFGSPLDLRMLGEAYDAVLLQAREAAEKTAEKADAAADDASPSAKPPKT